MIMNENTSRALVNIEDMSKNLLLLNIVHFVYTCEGGQ